MLISIKSTEAINLNLLLEIQHAWQLAAGFTILALASLVIMYIKTKGPLHAIV
jgi:hypothetical protein